jgi:hypothetical protein
MKGIITRIFDRVRLLMYPFNRHCYPFALFIPDSICQIFSGSQQNIALRSVNFGELYGLRTMTQDVDKPSVLYVMAWP